MQIKKWNLNLLVKQESLKGRVQELSGLRPGVSVALLSLIQALLQSQTSHTAAGYNERHGWLCASSAWQTGKSFP